MKNLESWVKENKVTAFVVGIIVVLVVFYLMKAAKEKEKRDERNEILDNSINVSNGGTASFNPKPFAEALKNDYAGKFHEKLESLNLPYTG